jgi:hypothetical protein
MAPSAWNEFVKQQTSENAHMLPGQLSHLYKNKMSHLVTVHIDYIKQLHQTIAELQKQCMETQNENRYLKEVLYVIYDGPLTDCLQ